MLRRVVLGTSSVRGMTAGGMPTAALKRVRRAAIRGGGQTLDLIDGKWSRTQAPLEGLESSPEAVLAYVGTAVVGSPDGTKLGLATPTSIPGRFRTYLPLHDFLGALGEGSVVFFDVTAADDDRQRLAALDLLREFDIAAVANGSQLRRTIGDVSGLVWLWETLLLGGPSAIPRFRADHLVTSARCLGDVDPDGSTTFVVSEGPSAGVEIWSNGNWSDLWRADVARLESDSKGSREDAIQELQRAMDAGANVRAAARTTLLFLAGSDASADVRESAARALTVSEEAAFPIITVQERDQPTIAELDFVVVPTGTYLIGSDDLDPDGLGEERPQHYVVQEQFMLMRTPLLGRHFTRFFGAGGQLPLVKFSDPDMPVTEIDWYEATAVARALTSYFRDSGQMSFSSAVALPSELEWEAAARGPQGNRYPWGDEFMPERCNCLSTGFNRPIASGQFSPQGDSSLGIQDMAGNVWEWTRSAWGTSSHYPDYGYPYVSGDGRELPLHDGHVRRVVRGGAYYYFDDCVRCATRNFFDPRIRHSGGGVRLALVESPG